MMGLYASYPVMRTVFLACDIVPSTAELFVDVPNGLGVTSLI